LCPNFTSTKKYFKMKKRNLLVGFFSILGMATMSNTLFAQQNLGAACGCPTVATRTSAAITSVGTWTTLPSSAYGKELNGSQNITLTCDKIWTLNEKLYIGNGSTLTIEPGTVIKGSDAGVNVAAARAIIIERGGKIIAPGVEDCPIVFTAAADNLDGTYSVNNKGKWGGILICGTAPNNLKINGNGPFVPGQGGKMAIADGLGVLEGFASSYPQDQFGVALSVPSGTTQSTCPAGVPNTQTTSDDDYSFGLMNSASLVGQPITTATGGQPTANKMNQSWIQFSSSVPFYVAPNQLVTSSVANAIPANTRVLQVINVSTASGGSVVGGYIQLSNNLGADITSSLITFAGDYPNPGVTGYFTSGSYVAPTSGAAPTSGTSGTVASYVGTYYTSTGGFNPTDNSGVMTYVSIRHSGANLLVGSEINGLTLASVGSGTKIEHIEIVSCADDNIEIFGGTVDLKYCTTLFGNDDMFDYDLGWTGRAQFLFGMKADLTSGISPDNDNGFECDGDDGKTYATPISAPKIYNATVMGNAKTTSTADNTGMIGLCLKEFAGGEIRNSVFAGFKEGVRMTSVTAATASYGNRSIAFGGEAVHNYLATGTTPSATSGNGSQRLKVKCNTFVGNTTAVNAFDAQTAAVAQLTADGNLFETTIPGFSSSFAITTANVVTTKNDATPNPALPLGTGCTQAPADGFFEPANYRGAFSSVAGDNWLSDWSYSELLGSTLGVVACPTDLNGDGTTDVLDFLIFGPAFGNDCN
jgi:hypothetical protein